LCSQCCGQNRRRNIDCPDDCRYFIAGRREALRRLIELGGAVELEREWFDVLNNLRLVLVRTRRNTVHDLSLAEAQTALTNVAETMRIRAGGLLYNFRSADPRVQTASDELSVVTDGHEQGKKGLRRVAAADLARCLRYVARQLQQALKKGLADQEVFAVLAQSVSSRLIGPEQADETGPEDKRPAGLVS